MTTKHTHTFKPGRGSVDVCACGQFRHNEKAGPAIVEQTERDRLLAVNLELRAALAGLNNEAVALLLGKGMKPEFIERNKWFINARAALALAKGE